MLLKKISPFQLQTKYSERFQVTSGGCQLCLGQVIKKRLKKKIINHSEQVDKMAHWKDRDTLSSEVPQNSAARPWGAK